MSYKIQIIDVNSEINNILAVRSDNYPPKEDKAPKHFLILETIISKSGVHF